MLFLFFCHRKHLLQGSLGRRRKGTFLLFLIEITFKTIGAKQESRCPRRGSRHLRTHSKKRDSLVTFDDEFIMDVRDNIHRSQRLHGVAENVTADGLRDVFYELRTVGFNPRPFFREIKTHVGNGFAAELVLSNARLHSGTVLQAPSRTGSMPQHTLPSQCHRK